MNHTGDLAAFGASDRACYDYPDDTEIAKAQRAAFCAGAAWAAEEIERLRAALKPFAAYGAELDANPATRGLPDEAGIAYTTDGTKRAITVGDLRCAREDTKGS